MTNYYLVVLLVRLLLPISLVMCIALRPFGISIIYLLLFLLAPLISIPDTRTFKGWRGTYLLLNVMVSCFLLLLHIAWHTMLATMTPYGALLVKYPILSLIGHNLGFVSYSEIDPFKAVHYMLPEVINTISSILVYYVVKRLLLGPSANSEQKPETKYQRYPLVTNAGKYLCLILIMFSGIMRPSVTSGIYYLMFMGSATAWALGQPLNKAFAVVCRCIMAIMAIHVILELVYQCSVLEELYPPHKEFARYFGLAKLVTINETNPSLFTYEVVDANTWATLASPFVILFTYFVLALETRELFKPQLIRVNSSKRRSVDPITSARQMRQDSTGSVVIQDTESNIGINAEPNLIDDIIMAVVDFFQVLIRSSYIATTITMMAWSIMYHSWLTFVFLMWANVVWLCHDQRGFMLKTSPVLVVYAMLLLIAEYIYGMDLLESELPSNIEHVNLQQIGLGRPETAPCIPLLIKSMFTCMFWVTLRQRGQDMRQRRKSTLIADMAAPLQLTASTAASVLATREEEMKRSRLMVALGEKLRSLCARYWIYVVVIMLFVIGISGKRMTIFRIIYMFLFLAFILMFQISWYWWRKLIYMFWIVVIIYSMINLILIYIYQFDNFSKIIEKYLMIDESLQQDLGLEPYHPADLFVKLLTPTSFLIITILQVHYFHKDFMALSDPRTRTNSLAPSRPESGKPSQDGVSTMRDDLPQLPSEDTNPRSQAGTEPDQSIELSSIHPAATDAPSTRSRTRWRTMSGLSPSGVKSGVSPSRMRLGAAPKPLTDSFNELLQVFVRRYHASKHTANDIKSYVFIYLDQHLIKIVFISLMLLCVMNVCAMHVPIMLLIAPALWFNFGKQRVCILFLSTLISIYFMAKMVYQINYIKHASSDVNCTKYNGKHGFNNAEWLGFEKVEPNKPLVTILKGYIGLLALFTFHALVTYRQESLRLSGALPKERTKTIFLNITRQEADIDLVHCIKYLFNYGFYKFGVEITLICLMGVIGSRMDLYAVLYAGWLLILVSINRRTKARWWPAFTLFITVLIPFQYIITVGFLPQLCVTYPWEATDQQMKHIRTWMFLPYAESPPHAYKIIFDFFVLLFATRQMKVFRIENTVGSNYPGGSNSENIGKDWETPDFVNPVPDFLSYVGTWLDVLKRMIFLGMLWITLAIMFMTGTNRVNLFSMGYLIGSFIFLWQGTDFYLRPKSAILKWWSWLVRYNVGVVVVKTLLQIPGCILSGLMQEHACWLVQLLGIGCVDKFAGGNIATFYKMNYTKEAACSVPQEDIGLAWDGVCFAFLILQQRLFHSFYFYRVIDESKATTVLASRGAELIEELRLKQMHVQEEQESKILDKIKVKMERIKANQKKIQGVLSKEQGHHDNGVESGTEGPSKCRVYTKRHLAIRSGDYYMFDEFDDTEIQMKEEEDSSDDEVVPKHMGIGKLQRKLSMSHRIPDTLNLSEAGEEPLTELDEFAPIPEKATFLERMSELLETAWAFISSFLASCTRHLLKYSRDYRYVSKTLSIEKKILKEKEGFGIGLREGSQMIWEPLPEALSRHHDVTMLEEQDDSMFKQNRSPFVHLGYAMWYVVLAHTDVVCYIMVFINQIQSATILSIPLPLMVFMWGTLTIPRPTKTFWVTLIAYTEVIVLIKSMFQFEILPWNQKVIPANMPFTAPRIIGIERKFNYALYDLLLLLIIFLHRFMLKSLGLWKESSPEIELREDMEYPLDQEDTQLVAEGHIDEVGRKYVKLHDQSGPDEDHLNDSAHRREGDRSDENDPGPSKRLKEDHYKDEDHLSDSVHRIEDGRSDENDPGPSKRLEDDHYNVNDDEEPMIAVSTTLEKRFSHYPEVIMLSVKRYLRPTHRFFQRMLAPGARVTADIYAYMFLCDFFNFLVVIFGFAAFGTHQGDGGVKAYLEENKVPIPFLVMLILQFALIVIDRALYLRKFMLGKILFQYALIIGVHIWMFFVLPFITERTFNALLPPPMWYMLKCIYLLLSAYQIRCGYPRRIIGNFLCKSYHYINMVFFRGFMVIPFLFELRTLMDWIWTDTSMTLMDWLKMEDIFASVFLLKCSRYIEDEFPQPRGSKKSSTVKYLLGGGVLAFVIAIIWFPLVFFAFGNSVGKPNPPTDVTVKIRIGPFLPIYQMSAQSNNIYVFTEQDYTQLSNLYARDRTAQTFLSNYVYNDVAVITINPNSTLKWEISPPELDRLEREAASNATLWVKFTYVITHPTNAVPNPPTIEDHREVPIPALINGQPNPQREILRQLLEGTSAPDAWLTVHDMFPKFLKVFNKGTTKAAYQLIPPAAPDEELSEEEIEYRDVLLRLERDKVTDVMYWRVRESCSLRDPLLSIPLNNCDMLVMYTFNDKLFPETLNFISGSGIIGLYTTFVFLASRVLRGFFSGIYTRIMFDDLPNVDRVLQLCLDIYLVREAWELALEEDLFAKLVFLYRSPETMIKWSRPKEEENVEHPALPPSR